MASKRYAFVSAEGEVLNVVAFSDDQPAQPGVRYLSPSELAEVIGAASFYEAPHEAGEGSRVQPGDKIEWQGGRPLDTAPMEIDVAEIAISEASPRGKEGVPEGAVSQVLQDAQS